MGVERCDHGRGIRIMQVTQQRQGRGAAWNVVECLFRRGSPPVHPILPSEKVHSKFYWPGSVPAIFFTLSAASAAFFFGLYNLTFFALCVSCGRIPAPPCSDSCLFCSCTVLFSCSIHNPLYYRTSSLRRTSRTRIGQIEGIKD